MLLLVGVVQMLVGGAGLGHSGVCGRDGCGRLATSMISKFI